MSTTQRRFYIDDIAEGIVTALRTQVQSALSLQIIQQGDFFSIPAPEDLSTRLPAVLVQFQDWQGKPDLKSEAVIGTYTFRVHYLRLFPDGGERERAISEDMQTLAGVFIQDNRTAALGPYNLPGFSAPHGLQLRKCYVTRLELLETMDFEALEVAIGHGIMELTVEADSFNYTQ